MRAVVGSLENNYTIIVLLQQSIISLRTLLIMRMLQCFCFAAVIYAIQELIFSLQKEQPHDYQIQTQKIYIANSSF